YGFYHDPANDNARFKLFFNPSQDVINNITPDDYFTVYSSGKKIFIIKNTVIRLKGDVIVYNLQGQVVATQPVPENKLIHLEINGPTGYYIVRVQTNQSVINSKVLIFN
ncbi:MAG TPA: T9SS type A sorting domain-containing protein, partial [Bacteroidetes bacterium]|nr:T9SS type A sorting domain-containing protein [Bacteroidota bacterium]